MQIDGTIYLHTSSRRDVFNPFQSRGYSGYTSSIIEAVSVLLTPERTRLRICNRIIRRTTAKTTIVTKSVDDCSVTLICMKGQREVDNVKGLTTSSVLSDEDS